MGTVSKPNTFTASTTAIASQVNDNFDTIYNDYNGSISNVNISASAAIADTKLAQITTASKVAVSAIVTTTDFTGTGNWELGSLTIEEGSDVSTAANKGAIYTKDIGSQPELVYREESDGDVVQLTSGGKIGGSAGTFTNVAVSADAATSNPDINTIYADTVCKAWGVIDTVGTLTIDADFNVVSVNDDATAKYTITFDTAFGDANYAMGQSTEITTSAEPDFLSFEEGTTPTTTACSLDVRRGSNGGLVDNDRTMFIFFGS